MHTNLNENTANLWAQVVSDVTAVQCKECHELKPRSEFHKDPAAKNGLYFLCKPCKNEKTKKNYHDNRDKHLKRMASFRQNNKAHVAKRDAASYQRSKAKRTAHKKKKYQIDVKFKLEMVLRSRIHKVMKQKNIVKQNRSIELLGCSVTDYKKYLENTFEDGMSWKNYGVEWHIDHIKPLASFDLTDAEQQKLAFNFKNTQALWKADNLSKGAKIDWIKPTTYATV